MRLSKEKLEAMAALDEAAEKSGGYIDKNANSPSYNIRNMHTWCIANDRDIEKLTPAEREVFRSSPESNKQIKAL